MEKSRIHQVGQRLAIGLPGTTVDDSFRRLVETYKIANVVLFAHNIESKEQLYALCKEIQSLVKEQTGFPAFITIDQEGGMVTRLSEDSTNLPGAMAIAATGNPENARLAGQITGKELNALGVNLNIAPVLDVNCNSDNPVIGVRSYGDSPEQVSRYAIPMFQGLLEEGVFATGKHFPGHGDTSVDSHLTLPKVDKSREELDAMELRPFVDAIEAGIPAIMSAHILFPALEPEDLPATMSRRILTDLLRGEMGFNGLILTDCLEMKAIQTKYGTVEGTLASAQAGADLLMISKSHELSEQAAQRLLAALEDGSLAQEEMDQSVRRILNAKAKLKADVLPLSIVGSAEHKATAQKLSDESITAVHIPAGGIPVLGDNPLFLGCMAYRSTIASTPPDERFVFPLFMQKKLGGAALVTPPTPTEEEIRDVISSIDTPSCIVISTYEGHIQRGQLALVKELEKLHIPLIVVALRSPYDLAGLSEKVTALAAYENSDRAFESIAKVLTGAVPLGKLPVRL